jgi:hypothetical protein
MRETGAADLLVTGSDVVPGVDGDNWCGAILVEDHLQPIREGVLLEADPGSRL